MNTCLKYLLKLNRYKQNNNAKFIYTPSKISHEALKDRKWFKGLK